MATNGDHRKIGVSTTIKSRLLAVQNGCPYPVILEGMWSHADPYSVEREAHSSLRIHRASGEWFKAERDAVFLAVLAALRNVPGGMMEYGDEFDFGHLGLTHKRGRPLKLIGPALAVAREAWDDATLSAAEAIDVIFEKTGVRVSLKTAWSALGAKALVDRATAGAPKKLTGDALDFARSLWGRRDLSYPQVVAEIKAKTGVEVSVKTLLSALGHKTDAVEKAERTLRRRAVPPPEKQSKPKRRKPARKTSK